MAQIYLGRQAYTIVYELKKQGYDIGELVSKLILEFAQNPDKEIPQELCGFCSHRYWSREALLAHITRAHKDRAVIKTEVGK